MRRKTLAQRVRRITRAIEQLTRAAYKSGHSSASASFACDRHGRRSNRSPEERAKRLHDNQLAASRRYYQKHKEEIARRRCKNKPPRDPKHKFELDENRRAKTFRARRLDAHGKTKIGEICRQVGGGVKHAGELNAPFRGDDNRSAEQLMADWQKDHPTDEIEEALKFVECLRN